MRTYFLLAVAALLGIAGPALGQQTIGDTQLQLQGSVFLGGSGDKDNSGAISVDLGRFFTDNQEIGLTATGGFVTNGKFSGFGGAYYRYNFSQGKIVPYLGAAAGTTFGNLGNSNSNIKIDSTSTIATAEAGVRFFVDRRTAFTVETSKNYFFKTKDFDKGLTIQFGFSHLWGK
jgi:hypothetical protein